MVCSGLLWLALAGCGSACGATETDQPGRIPHVIGPSQRDLRFLAHSPTWCLRAGLVLVALLALALGIVTRATSGSQAVDRLVGRSAPAFSLPVESHGQARPGQISLASRRGHPVLLIFFYTLC